MEEAAHWSDFLVAEVGAAAALSGLVVVAISFNIQRILSVPALPGRAAETLVMLVCALLICSTGLIPQTPRSFGIEVLAFGATIWIASLFTQLRALVQFKNPPLRYWLIRLTVALIAAAPITIGGALLVEGHVEGMYWVAAGVLGSLAAGVLNSWVLLIEILR
jgi:hypothetical protein